MSWKILIIVDYILGSLWVSGKLPSYPSPKPTLTLSFHLGQNVGLREGAVSQKRLILLLFYNITENFSVLVIQFVQLYSKLYSALVKKVSELIYWTWTENYKDLFQSQSANSALQTKAWFSSSWRHLSTKQLNEKAVPAHPGAHFIPWVEISPR